MANNNARLIEKDALADVPSTSAGNSEIIDLNGASKFSCQAIYDVQAPSAKTFDDGEPATLTNQDITYTANLFGVEGNDIEIVLVDTEVPDEPFAIDVVGSVITITLECDSMGDVVTDADALVAALNLDPDASVLVTASGTGATPLIGFGDNLADGVASEVDLDNSSLIIPAHGFSTGFKIRLTTTGTLPAPLMTATDYFIIVVDSGVIQLAASLADALVGIEIELEDQGSSAGVGTVTGVALAGASITFQKSNDGVNFENIQAATSITVDGSVLLVQPNVSYRYFKAVKALTAGQVDLKALVLVIGDAQ